MASKYFTGVKNLRKTLSALSEGESVILQLADGVKYNPAMRAVTATLCRASVGIKVSQQSLAAIEIEDCQALRLIKVTRIL